MGNHNRKISTRLLVAGELALGLEFGIVSKIYGNQYELVAIDDLFNEFQAGDVVPLDKAYGREVMATGRTIALSEINGVSGLREHPLYVENTVEAYIGAPILVNNNIWGTINFSTVRIRNCEFSTAEIALVNSFAKLISESTLVH